MYALRCAKHSPFGWPEISYRQAATTPEVGYRLEAHDAYGRLAVDPTTGTPTV